MSIDDPNDPRHGTNAGFVAHQRAKVEACEPCRAGRIEARRRQRTPTPRRADPRTIAELAATQDVDRVVVERILSGSAVPANAAERLETVRQWLGSGRTLHELYTITRWDVYKYARIVNLEDTKENA